MAAPASLDDILYASTSLEDQQTVQAFSELQQADQAKQASKKPKKPSKKEVMRQQAPAGQQYHFGKFPQKPEVGMRVRIFDSHIHQDGQPVAGRYGFGPCLLDTKVASIKLSEDGENVIGCVTECGKELELKRTGLWNLVDDNKIKKPHKRNIVKFGDKYDEISFTALQQIKDVSTKKRKTEREIKALERKKQKIEAKPKKAGKTVRKPKQRKPEPESEESSDSESSSSSSSSSSNSSSSTTDGAIASDLLVSQIVDKVSAVFDAKLKSALGKRKRDSAPVKKPAKRVKK